MASDAAVPPPRVRPPTRTEREAVEALLRAARLPLAGFDRAWPDAVVAVDADGRTLLGAAALERHGEAALLRSVVVAPDRRGAGIGEALVRDRLAAADRDRLETWLLTTTAERWFPRFGFVAATRTDAPAALQASAEFAGACPSSAAVLRRAAAVPSSRVRP